jgi:tetratricopeptide (TPR) repeat protein
MIPIFTISVVVFVIVLKITMNKNARLRSDAEASFWEREHQANFTRKQDISGLDYITIPLDKFPQTLGTESEKKLEELSHAKILNLTGISNTDLKMRYGVANLEALTEYDNNFTLLVQALADYGNELSGAGQTEDAQTVLEYAVSIHADSKQIYTTLAGIYRANGQSEKIAELIASAESLSSISRDGILAALNEIQERP